MQRPASFNELIATDVESVEIVGIPAFNPFDEGNVTRIYKRKVAPESTHLAKRTKPRSANAAFTAASQDVRTFLSFLRKGKTILTDRRKRWTGFIQCGMETFHAKEESKNHQQPL